MDTILALVIIIAILALGAILSIGNERQRRALEGIRQQAAGWTLEDLRLKRAAAAGKIKVDDPQAWLEIVVGRIFGSPPRLEAAQVWRQDGLVAITCQAQDGRSLVFSPAPPERFIKALSRSRKDRLGSARVGVLGKKPRRVPVTELSALNGGTFFDLEAQQVWKALTGEELAIDRMWLFETPPRG